MLIKSYLSFLLYNYLNIIIGYFMTIVDEKEILEVEKLKADLHKVIQDTGLDMKKFEIELSKKTYEAWRLAFYGIAVGAGGTFAIAKTLQLLQTTTP
jgi:hypothetical protein